MILPYWLSQPWWPVMRQNEKVKEAPSSRENDSCFVRGNKGESLFRRVHSQRGVTNAIIQKIISGWNEASRRQRQRLGWFEEYCLKLDKGKDDLVTITDHEKTISSDEEIKQR
ncbi:MAG: hypothetical protein EZS28_041097 [Streblomastix strix]|uniref:Uncharacterized protein n=1 Tax=Streblomastix strix TaxID=222440 RepID=A0A5J4TY10_9EUKA|nr:MAG: hypothetical protein EZS28_041097 [Streblomastix strix]